MTQKMDHHWIYRDHDYAGDRARFPAHQVLRREGFRISLQLSGRWYLDLVTGSLVSGRHVTTRGMLPGILPRYRLTGVFSDRRN